MYFFQSGFGGFWLWAFFLTCTCWQMEGGGYFIPYTVWPEAAERLSRCDGESEKVQVAGNSKGEMVLLWLKNKTFYQAAFSQNWGENFSYPYDLENEGRACFLGALALNSQSRALALWGRSEQGTVLLEQVISQNGGKSWSLPATLLSLEGLGYFNVALNDREEALLLGLEKDQRLFGAFSQDGGTN
ncbi:MAG: hypothetical protein WC371_05000, partial [Parachlamydiales bacterium]